MSEIEIVELERSSLAGLYVTNIAPASGKFVHLKDYEALKARVKELEGGINEINETVENWVFQWDGDCGLCLEIEVMSNKLLEATDSKPESEGCFNCVEGYTAQSASAICEVCKGDYLNPPKLPYGYCPKCGNPGASRERRPNGYDECVAGHKYLSKDALTEPPKG